MSLDALAALVTPAGRELVDALTPYDSERALAQVAAARRDPRWAERPEVVAAAATQARLRTRAAGRFPGAPRWWTPDGLEQATRPEVSARHAQRYVEAGITEVADLGCGAGSDALSAARAGIAVTAVDRDPESLWALAATASDEGLTLETLLADVTDPGHWWSAGSVGPTRGCFVDPARRRAGRRLLRPQDWSPPWDWVTRLADRVPATGAKVAPGIAHEAVPGTAQAEWVSVDGDLVECAVWWGPLRSGPATRIATVLAPAQPDAGPADGPGSGTARTAGAPARTVASLADAEGIPTAPIGPLGTWLVEPDPAVIRAGLVSVLAERLDGHLLDPRIAYVATDRAPDAGPFGRAYEVLAEVPFARKALRAHLRAAGYSDVVVKKRGVNVVPEQLRAALRLTGTGPTATLMLTRTDAGPLAVLVRPA